MHATHDLSVWRKANELAQRIHAVTSDVRSTPHADVAQRLRQVALAVPIAIDAGAQGDTPSEFTGYLEHAIRLTREVEYLLAFLRELGALDTSECTRLLARTDLVRRMAAGLQRTVQTRAVGSPRGGNTPRDAHGPPRAERGSAQPNGAASSERRSATRRRRASVDPRPGSG